MCPLVRNRVHEAPLSEQLGPRVAIGPSFEVPGSQGDRSQLPVRSRQGIATTTSVDILHGGPFFQVQAKQFGSRDGLSLRTIIKPANRRQSSLKCFRTNDFRRFVDRSSKLLLLSSAPALELWRLIFGKCAYGEIAGRGNLQGYRLDVAAG